MQPSTDDKETVMLSPSGIPQVPPATVPEAVLVVKSSKYCPDSGAVSIGSSIKAGVN